MLTKNVSIKCSKIYISLKIIIALYNFAIKFTRILQKEYLKKFFFATPHSMPGIEPMFPAMELWCLNHWITREAPRTTLKPKN